MNNDHVSVEASGVTSSTWRRVLVLLAVLALLAAACGDDDDGDTAEADDSASAETDDTADESAADSTEEPAEDSADEPADEAADDTAEEPAEASGEPIKVMATGTIESPVFSVPTVATGAQIAIDEINAAGGVNGSPLELLVCNDELDPNVATACVQQAIDEGAVAFVGGISVFSSLILPLTDGQLPWVGLSAGDSYDASNFFNIAADGATAFAGAGRLAAESGCTNVAVFISATATELNGPAISAGVVAAGGEVVSTQQGNGGDFAPLVEAALADGAECIASGVSPAETGPLLGAIAGRLPFFTIDGSLPAGLAAALGEGAEGVRLVAGFVPPGAGNERVDGLAETVAGIDPTLSLDQFFYTGYTGAYIVAETLADAGEYTPQAVFDGLPSVVGFDTGVGPVVDFSTSVGVPGLSSVYNPDLYVLEVQGGAYVLAEDEPIDMRAALEVLGAS